LAKSESEREYMGFKEKGVVSKDGQHIRLRRERRQKKREK
jgi:hypothetical protein